MMFLSKTLRLSFILIIINFLACHQPAGSSKAEAKVATQDVQPIYTFTQVVTNAQLPSPRKQIEGTSGDLSILIDYGSPSVKGRDVWGSLVPFGEVWRTGANEATIFRLEQDAQIEGQLLPAGSYSVFSIPTTGEWTIIFNKVFDQWGAYNYDESQDVLRVKVNPKKVEKLSETLEFTIAEGEVAVWWEYLKIPLKVG